MAILALILFLVVLGCILLPIFWAWKQRSKLGSMNPAFIVLPILLVGLATSVVGIGAIYVLGEFVINVGPDDWGAAWHAGYPLSDKYGSVDNRTCQNVGFDKDVDGSGSGTYRVHYGYGVYAGIVRCHYNKVTRNFDHDEIQEQR